MHILIDDQRPVEVNPKILSNEDGEQVLALGFDDLDKVLTTWQGLHEGWRGYRWTEGDTELTGEDEQAYTVVIAEATRHGLNLDDIDAHWDGRRTWPAWSLDKLSITLPLKWGEAIGEPVVS